MALATTSLGPVVVSAPCPLSVISLAASLLVNGTQVARLPSEILCLSHVLPHWLRGKPAARSGAALWRGPRGRAATTGVTSSAPQPTSNAVLLRPVSEPGSTRSSRAAFSRERS